MDLNKHPETFINWMIKEEKFSKASTDDCLFKQEYERNGKKYFILLLMYVDGGGRRF